MAVLNPFPEPIKLQDHNETHALLGTIELLIRRLGKHTSVTLKTMSLKAGRPSLKMKSGRKCPTQPNPDRPNDSRFTITVTT